MSALSTVQGPVTRSESLNVCVRKHVRSDFDIDADLVVPPGIAILFGPSGSGKTTLLDLISGSRNPDSGRIALGNDVLYDSSRGVALTVWHRRIGYVFQDLALFPHLTALQNVEYGLRHLSAEERRHRSLGILRMFRIDGLKDRRPGEISGGERQRVALARALVTEPRALLLDEPLAALDRPTKSSILEDLRTWNRHHGVPILYVTHSREEVFALGDRVFVLEAGRVVARGSPHEVMRAPRLETVADLAGFENVFDVVVSSIHEDRGTMICRLEPSVVQIETPMVSAHVGSRFRLGFRAGDILLGVGRPHGLSARNVIAGSITRLERRDVIIAAYVNCGVEVEVHLTLAARDTLGLSVGQKVWLILKTHTCHLMSD